MNTVVNRSFLSILRHSKTICVVGSRPIKNFGHKRQPVPLVTTLWHGFLTFTFIGLVLNWNKMKTFIFGSSENMLDESKELNDKI